MPCGSVISPKHVVSLKHGAPPVASERFRVSPRTTLQYSATPHRPRRPSSSAAAWRASRSAPHSAAPARRQHHRTARTNEHRTNDSAPSNSNNSATNHIGRSKLKPLQKFDLIQKMKLFNRAKKADDAAPSPAAAASSGSAASPKKDKKAAAAAAAAAGDGDAPRGNPFLNPAESSMFRCDARCVVRISADLVLCTAICRISKSSRSFLMCPPLC